VRSSTPPDGARSISTWCSAAWQAAGRNDDTHI
jgi:hypothetical protein